MATNIKNSYRKNINTQEQIIHIVSLTARSIETWAANWNRYGRLKLASHPTTSTSHLISQTIREAHDGERDLRIDCWNKLHREYPGISYTFFDDVFHDLLQQVYFNLKSDLYCYRM